MNNNHRSHVLKNMQYLNIEISISIAINANLYIESGMRLLNAAHARLFEGDDPSLSQP